AVIGGRPVFSSSAQAVSVPHRYLDDTPGGPPMVADLSGGRAPASVGYREVRGQTTAFNGWTPASAGDFMGLGHAQLLSVNPSGSGGRIMIADFSGGRPPAVVRYWESWGDSTLFNGWTPLFAGDFMGLGHAQLLSMNPSGSGCRIMVADLGGGRRPAALRFAGRWGQSTRT